MTSTKAAQKLPKWEGLVNDMHIRMAVEVYCGDIVPDLVVSADRTFMYHVAMGNARTYHDIGAKEVREPSAKDTPD